MMAICLASSPLMAEAQARLLTYRNEYTFDGVEYASLMYKIIMRHATINSDTTTQTLRENLQNLGVFAGMVNMTSTRSMVSLTGITHSCWSAVPLLMTLLGSGSMPTLLSPATTSRSKYATTMMIGLTGN